MEKHIMRWSYWLGVICVALAVLTRLLNTVGLSTTLLQTRGDSISFRTDLTGIFCTSGSEREFTLEGSWYADQEIQAGADRDAAAAG
jgi:hypothetical protein